MLAARMDGHVRGQRRRPSGPVHRLGVRGEEVEGPSPSASASSGSQNACRCSVDRRGAFGVVAGQRRRDAARSVNQARPAEGGAAGAFGDLMPDAGSRRPGAGDPKAHAVRHPRRHALFSQLLRGGAGAGGRMG